MRMSVYLVHIADVPESSDPIFTAEERRYCDTRHDPASSLAGRYAAKRAAVKALNLPVDTPLDRFEVMRKQGRAPRLLIHEVPKREAHVSLSHSGDYAVAMVVVELE